MTKYSDVIRRLFLQIEALYVFSMLKSTITSQFGRDTWVRKVLRDHDIPLDSPALTYFDPPVREKSSFGPQIASFNIREVKQSLCTSSLLLTRPSFMQLQSRLSTIFHDTLALVPLFSAKPDPAFLLAHGGDNFKKNTVDELLLKLSSYPLSNYRYFIAAQKVVAEQYHKVLKYRWQEGIYRAMQGLVETEFEYKDGVHL